MLLLLLSMLLRYSVVVDAVVATYVSYCRLLWLMSKYEKFLRMVISRVLQNWWLIIVQILQPKMTHSSVGQKAIFVAQKLLHFVIFVFVVQAEKWSERFNKKNKVPAIFSASKTESNLVRTYQILDLPQVLHCCKTQNLRGGHYNIGKDFLRLWPLPKSSASSLVYLGGR